MATFMWCQVRGLGVEADSLGGVDAVSSRSRRFWVDVFGCVNERASNVAVRQPEFHVAVCGA